MARSGYFLDASTNRVTFCLGNTMQQTKITSNRGCKPQEQWTPVYMRAESAVLSNPVTGVSNGMAGGADLILQICINQGLAAALSGLYIALVIQIPAVTALVWPSL